MPVEHSPPRYYKDGPCPTGCGGYLRTTATNADTDGDGLRTRYFRCRKCKHRCSDDVPADSVPRRNVLSKHTSV